MARFAKILVMLVRVVGVVEIVLGVLLASARLQLLPTHMGLGFLVTLCIFVLAVLAFARQKIGIGVVGVVFAGLLPFTGIKQFPLKFGSQLGLIQIVHVVIALVAIGIAEALNGAIHKPAQ